MKIKMDHYITKLFKALFILISNSWRQNKICCVCYYHGIGSSKMWDLNLKVAKLEINLRHYTVNVKLSFHENLLECLQHRLFQAKWGLFCGYIDMLLKLGQVLIKISIKLLKC